jgi:hypothetical protein
MEVDAASGGLEFTFMADVEGLAAWLDIDTYMGFKSAMIMTPHAKGKKSVNHVTSLGVLAAMLTNGIQVLTNRTIGKNGEAENVTGG